MKKIGKFGVAVGLLVSLAACSKDGRDDTVMEISRLTGKYWYYNGWQGDKYGMSRKDVLEVLRLEKGGILKTMDYGGHRENIVGKWSSKDNAISLEYADGNTVNWSVLHSGDDYIQAIVNDQGEKKYVTDLGYLENLTADAYLVNEYTPGNVFQTRIGVDVRGNIDVREGDLIREEGKNIPLENHGYYWSERKPQQSDYIKFGGEKREVRFYLRIKKTEVKLQDTIYTENMPERIPADLGLSAHRQDGVLNVSWHPYDRNDVYYRVEIYPRNMDLKKPYFVSRIQPGGSERLDIKATTAGEINKIEELKTGETYTVRLVAIMYEPGIDWINDEYSYANLQAVTYFTGQFVW